ncbi:MAG: SsrA-binding protein SmpB [Planctomycetales bacterium]|nr:SsrA-binding protein SmpB [Planctomycetales bacterium]
MAREGSDGAGKPDRKVVARNRKAWHKYVILESQEAGIVLTGPEVKSLREGKASIAESYGRVKNREVFLLNMDVPPYGPAAYVGHEPKRERKLLLHRSEIEKLSGRLEQKGTTLVPLSLYFKDGRAKVELALARTAHRHDRREAEREKSDRRAMRRAKER